MHLGKLACSILAALTLAGCQRGGPAAQVPSQPKQNVTFNRDVAPILFANCSSCHRPGEAAPFSLLSYADARRRASQIAELTQRRIMPPWLPVAGHGEFAASRRLSDEQIQTIQSWAKSGAAEGDAADLPPVPTIVKGWQLGAPDLVFESPHYKLPADGGDVFRNFVIPIEIAEPKWVETIELRAMNPRATHHARLGVDRTRESERRDAADPEPGYDGMAWGQDPEGQLTTWVPGMVPHRAAAGAAWRLYPKTCVVLHAHMQPTGKPESVQFRIGMHFAKSAPTLRPVVMRVGSRNIDIAPSEVNFAAVDEFVVPVDIEVRSIFPHAHSICRTVAVNAELPGGATKPLVQIDDFNEKWHDDYQYVEPVRLPKGTKIRSTFTYDNSVANVRNRHHPPTRVVYGSNAADEMADVYLQVTTVAPDQRAVLMEAIERYDASSQLVGFTKSLEMYPDDPWLREGLASCQLSAGNTQAAIQTLEDRIKLGVDPMYAQVSLANACMLSGDKVRAEKLAREVLEKDKEYPLAWLALARAVDARGAADLAENAYRRAIELAPAHIDAYLALADNLLKQNKLAAAREVCSEAINFSPDAPNAYLKLASVQAREKQYDECFKSLETAQRLAPYTHPPKVLLAVYYFQNGDAAKAQQLLHESLAETPHHPVVELFLGQFALRGGKLADARHYLDDAASRAMPANWPESHRKRFAALVGAERLKLAEQLQDERLARAAVDEWIKYDPENKELQEIYKRLHPVNLQ